jgi:hypothetical protein
MKENDEETSIPIERKKGRKKRREDGNKMNKEEGMKEKENVCVCVCVCVKEP